MSVKKATSLTMKLAQLLEEIAVAEQHGQPFNFGMIRNMLGKRRIILLPCVKNHHEVALPSRANGQASSFDRVRVTVVLEVFGRTADDGQQIVEIVGNATGEKTDRLHLLGLQKRRRGLLLLRLS